MTTDLCLLRPDWPAPANVRAACTTRAGGVSLPPWDSLNLGLHVDDEAAHVATNRQRLADALGLDVTAFGWLSQVHGTGIAELPLSSLVEADGSTARTPGQVCTILTADCLPVLICDRAGTQVAAAHAGWRGLCNGVLEALVDGFDAPATELMAWLGPAIGPGAFEVGSDVRDAFMARDRQCDSAFTQVGARPGHFLADIYRLARQRLAAVGINQIDGGGFCTLTDDQRFFSYRRDGRTGRMVSLIWLAP